MVWRTFEEEVGTKEPLCILPPEPAGSLLMLKERMKNQPKFLNQTDFFDLAQSLPIHSLSLLLSLAGKQNNSKGR